MVPWFDRYFCHPTPAHHQQRLPARHSDHFKRHRDALCASIRSVVPEGLLARLTQAHIDEYPPDQMDDATSATSDAHATGSVEWVEPPKMTRKTSRMMVKYGPLAGSELIQSGFGNEAVARKAVTPGRKAKKKKNKLPWGKMPKAMRVARAERKAAKRAKRISDKAELAELRAWRESVKTAGTQVAVESVNEVEPVSSTGRSLPAYSLPVRLK